MSTEKEAATPRFRSVQRIWWMLRFLEAAGALLLLFYFSSCLPAVARNSGEILTRASAVLISPSFVFLLGNAIVVVLFAKSGKIGPYSESENAPFSFVDQSSCICSDQSFPPPAPPHLREAEEIVFEDKGVCLEIRAAPLISPENVEIIKEETKTLEKSEIGGDLQKSPEIRMKGMEAHDRVDGDGEEDAEQFRRTIEEFIARQQRFQRQESLTVVPYSAGLSEPVAV